MAEVSNYSPYAPNAQGFTEALIDLKSTIADQPAHPVPGFLADNFEDVVQGDALYLRSSDGKVGKAIASSTEDQATVIGFAQTSKFAGQKVRVLIIGVLATSGLDAGDIYYLSATTPGMITTTPPSAAGQFVTRVGEAASTAELIIQIEPPIGIS